MHKFSCHECSKHFYSIDHGEIVSLCEDKKSQISKSFALENHFCCEKIKDYYPGHS